MKIAVLILFCILSVGMGVLLAIFNKKNGWQGIVLRGLTLLVLLTMSLVLANLRELTNVLTLFVPLGLAILMLSQVTMATNSIDDKGKLIVFSIFDAVSTIFFALGALSLSQFNVFALLGGLLTGLGMGLTVCAFKKNWALYPILMEIIVWLSMGLLLGLSFGSVIISQHLTSSILLFIGGIILIVEKLLERFGGDKKVTNYISHALLITSLILITISIYFF